MASVPLKRNDKAQSHPPVWPITHAAPNTTIPSSAKCSRLARGDRCCKELIDDDDRTLVDPDLVRDAIIGLSDGLTVPFALTAGLSSLGESRLVILGGIAELIAGAISMGVGGFLASQAERDHYRYQRKQTSARVSRSCDEELEREVTNILGPIGLDEDTCSTVAKRLRSIELQVGPEQRSDRPNSPRDEEQPALRWSNQVGLSAFLLKFGEGMEEVPTERLYISAFTIGMGYLLGGLIPLLPYFFIPRAAVALIYSCILTGVVLLIFGAVKARITGAGMGFWSYSWGAVSTLAVGGVSAGAAWGIVRALEHV